MLSRAAKPFNSFLKIFYFYLAFSGIFSFSLFLLEETTQCIEWGGFAAKDAHRYDLLLENCEMLEEICVAMEFINEYFVWMIPPQHYAYKSYIAGTRQYVKCIQAEILANKPDLFVGRHISIDLAYNNYKPAQNGLFVAQAGLIKAIVQAAPQPGGRVLHISGVPRPDPDRGGGIIIENLGPSIQSGNLN